LEDFGNNYRAIGVRRAGMRRAATRADFDGDGRISANERTWS
jgi:hypothetical protein